MGSKNSRFQNRMDDGEPILVINEKHSDMTEGDIPTLLKRDAFPWVE